MFRFPSRSQTARPPVAPRGRSVSRRSFLSSRSLAFLALGLILSIGVSSPSLARIATGPDGASGALAVGGPALAVGLEDEGPSLRGHLESRRVLLDGKRVERLVVEVGDVAYAVEAGAEVLAELGSLRREWVDVRGEIAGAGQGEGEGEGKGGSDGDVRTVRIASAGDVTPQEDAVVEGFVVEPAEGEKEFLIRAGEREWRVADKRAGRKLKGFVGRNVVVHAGVAFDGTLAILDEVDDVVRKKLPSEREPRNEAQALEGAWKGKVDVTELPAQVTGARIGEYPIEFVVGDKLQLESGRLLGTYDLVAVAVRKFSMKRREFRIELTYEIPGHRKYPVTLIGSFAPDWKSATGDFETSFLGTGTFDISWRDPAPKSRQDSPSKSDSKRR